MCRFFATYLSTFRPGEVHALAGANGAGKSTLMNIIGGVLVPDDGTILWDGAPAKLKTPADARALGISFVHQELALVPQLSVGENVFLGRHPRNRFGVSWDVIHSRTRELLAGMGHTLDPTRPVRELGVAEQQLVEIARALAIDARLIIMDEPTAPLSKAENRAAVQYHLRVASARHQHYLYHPPPAGDFSTG